jgi:hypothetical protein
MSIKRYGLQAEGQLAKATAGRDFLPTPLARCPAQAVGVLDKINAIPNPENSLKAIPQLGRIVRVECAARLLVARKLRERFWLDLQSPFPSRVVLVRTTANDQKGNPTGSVCRPAQSENYFSESLGFSLFSLCPLEWMVESEATARIFSDDVNYETNPPHPAQVSV